MDLVQCWDAADKPWWCLNVTGAASGFQLCVRVAAKTSEAVIDKFKYVWASWAGFPVTAVVNLGPEFASAEFTDFFEKHGTKVYHTHVEAPWQNGVA